MTLICTRDAQLTLLSSPSLLARCTSYESSHSVGTKRISRVGVGSGGSMVFVIKSRSGQRREVLDQKSVNRHGGRRGNAADSVMLPCSMLTARATEKGSHASH